jgi:hypothetical protein
MDNPEKLATHGTPDEDKHANLEILPMNKIVFI